jgi:hypothetical protein
MSPLAGRFLEFAFLAFPRTAFYTLFFCSFLFNQQASIDATGCSTRLLFFCIPLSVLFNRRALGFSIFMGPTRFCLMLLLLFLPSRALWGTPSSSLLRRHVSFRWLAVDATMLLCSRFYMFS